ncbi:MAG TPA: SpoIIE family protein phosphatase [Spirochaetota bacterium]|nr:SpoIIE family protein phosphatase [Spirochaetota bacterium]HOD16061.1 SpoIIE family protein phosphatase [Spirochaetota bacterium]HPN13317.1 SpoIIE family protein phosphatase [Spirochaetota bacterium]
MELIIPKFNIYIIPPLLSLVISLIIALLSVIKGKITRENMLFSLVCIWWSLLAPVFICHHLFRGEIDLLLRIERGVHFFYVYLPALNLVYFHRIIGTRARGLVMAAFAVSFIISLSTLTDYYFNGLYVYPWGYIAKGGIAFQVFGLYSFISLTYFILIFIRKIRSEKNQIIRLKLKYIVLSFILTGLLTMSNIPAINGIDLYPLGNLMFLPLAFLGYGVLSYRLMDIRSVLHVTFIWAAMSSLILIPNIILFYFVLPYLGMMSGPSLFLAAVAWFVGNYAYFRKVQPRIDQLFNRRKYDLDRVESSFIDNISSLKSIDDLGSQFSGLIRRTLSFKSAELLLCRRDGDDAVRTAMRECEVAPDIAAWFVGAKHLVDRAMVESRGDYTPVRDGLLELFDRYGATYIVPFVHQGELLAILLLPEKQNLRQITAYEVGFINRIKSAATIALANSIMYSRLSTLKDNLEQLVEERTAELLRAMKALWGEMELAKKIQTVLLPRAPAISGLEIAAYMRPADEVGGDYYDVINAKGIDWLVIGDVSGHGVPAGLIMMMVQTAIHTVLEGKPNLEPDVVLSRVNRVITENIKRLNEDRYMTITVIASLAGGTFHFSGQHQHIMIYRSSDGSLELVETDGIWLGIAESLKPPASGGFTLGVGDALLLYTDGLTDAWRAGTVKDRRDPENDMFGLDRLEVSFRRRGDRSPAEIKDGILGDLAGYEFNDDVTIVVVKRVE